MMSFPFYCFDISLHGCENRKFSNIPQGFLDNLIHVLICTLEVYVWKTNISKSKRIWSLDQFFGKNSLLNSIKKIQFLRQSLKMFILFLREGYISLSKS